LLLACETAAVYFAIAAKSFPKISAKTAPFRIFSAKITKNK
jgi:hypothetical protein